MIKTDRLGLARGAGRVCPAPAQQRDPNPPSFSSARGAGRGWLAPALLLALLPTVPDRAMADQAGEAVEARIALKLIEEVRSAELVWLDAGGASFLNLYTPPRRHRDTLGLILLPTLGMHPDWPELIGPLRLALAAANRGNLSMQLPMLFPTAAPRDYGKILPQALRRLHAGIDHLEARGDSRIVLIGYGFGALLAARALTRNPPAALLGMVGINMREYGFLHPPLELHALLETIRVPVLDIYPEGPRTDSAAQALDRRLAARRGGNRHYLQTAFASPFPHFNGREEALAERIDAWLRQFADGAAPGEPSPGP